MFKRDYKIEARLLNKYLKHIHDSHPLFRQIKMSEDIHHGGVRYENGEKELVVPKSEISATAILRKSDTELYNIERFCEEIYSIGEQQIKSKSEMLLNTMDHVSDLTGIKVDAKGASLSPDLILETLEKMELHFDENGKPNLPTFVASPELSEKFRNIMQSEENQRRFDELIDRKRKQFYAKKRNRKLSRIY